MNKINISLKWQNEYYMNRNINAFKHDGRTGVLPIYRE